VVAVLVLVGLGVLVTVPMALLTSTRRQDSAGAPTTNPQLGAPTSGLTAPASVVPATGEPAQTTVAEAATSPSGPPTAHAPTPGFTAMTLEAEAASITRPARVISYPGASNGSIVTGIGTTDDASGSIKFTNIAIPTTGTYLITVYYVNLDGSATSADISVSGVGTVTHAFPGNSVCWTSVALSAMTIAAGTHTITIENHSGHGPGIDKIVISRTWLCLSTT
jgi:hypothetical protein